MVVREFWNGREIKGDDKELMEHQQKILQDYFDSLCRAGVKIEDTPFEKIQE